MQPSTSTLPDIDLVEAARDGDHEALAQLLGRHDERMRQLTYRLVADRSRMDAVLQEAYLKAFQGLHSSKAASDFETWLYRITYNACIDELRRAPGGDEPAAEDSQDAEGTEDAEGGAGPDDPVPDRTPGAAEAVRRALEALPDDQRVSVVLVDAEGFDPEEAAKILDVPADKVVRRLLRAREALRDVLGEELA